MATSRPAGPGIRNRCLVPQESAVWTRFTHRDSVSAAVNIRSTEAAEVAFGSLYHPPIVQQTHGHLVAVAATRDLPTHVLADGVAQFAHCLLKPD